MTEKNQIQPVQNSGNSGIVVHGPAAIARAKAIADEFSRLIEAKKLYKVLGGKRHILVEGWQTVGALMGGIFPVEVGARQWRDEGGLEFWEVTVELRDASGKVYGRASGVCGEDEPSWRERKQFNKKERKYETVKVPTYARRAMAHTRAVSRAYRALFGWVVTLAGFEPTPAEEMEAAFVEGEFRPVGEDEQQKNDKLQTAQKQGGEPHEQKPAKPKTKRPLDPESLISGLRTRADGYKGEVVDVESMLPFIRSLFGGDENFDAVVKAVFGKTDLGAAEVYALQRWLEITGDGDNMDYGTKHDQSKAWIASEMAALIEYAKSTGGKD